MLDSLFLKRVNSSTYQTDVTVATLYTNNVLFELLQT